MQAREAQFHASRGDDSGVFDLYTFAGALGWVGAALSLLSYLLVTTGRAAATSLAYQCLVLASASTLAFSTAIFGAWPSAVTNLIYIAIGLVTISLIAWKRSAALRTAVRAALRTRAVDAAHTAHVVDMRARTALEVYSGQLAAPHHRTATGRPARRTSGGATAGDRAGSRRRAGFVSVPKQRLIADRDQIGVHAAPIGVHGAPARF